jgi:chitin disaccharide deacetylase
VNWALAINTEEQIPLTSLSEGRLIVNADDWGRDTTTTDRTRDCFVAKSVSSASAMVFMSDSERAADFATQHAWDCGLHLNFTTPFSASNCPARLREHQQKIARYLSWHRFASVCFHPGLTDSFEYVVRAQSDEFRRIYGAQPARIDGHHHMHLCANVVLGELLPAGTLVRRNFSFAPGEKSWINRSYRGLVDRRLARRHRQVDFLFPLAPLAPTDRLQRIFGLARHAVVELETHPANPDEHQFLTSGEMFQQLGDVQVAPEFAAPPARASRFLSNSGLRN